MAAAALVLLAACSTASSAPPQPPHPGTAAYNPTVCRHYLAQRRWVLSITQPTLADAVQMETDVAVDAEQAYGKLRRDLDSMSAAMSAGQSPHAASVRVYDDCT